MVCSQPLNCAHDDFTTLLPNRMYGRALKFSDARKFCCNLHKIQTKRPNLRVFHQKDANGIANSEDPDQTAPLLGSALFAMTYYLSENLGSLRYTLSVL